jgi:Icc-related predicted phosphoesterase
VTVLDDETVEIGGVRFFGSTLWTDFEGRSEIALQGMRRRMGEYFFVRTRSATAGSRLSRFRPEDALAAHDRAWSRLRAEVEAGREKPTVVVTHHAPSLQGLNPQFTGNGLDGAYASNLDEAIAALAGIAVWVHGHTHIAGEYRIGRTVVRSNARGFVSKGQMARGFNPGASFEI